MRIADKMAFDQVNANVGKNRTQMSELQNQAATQKRVTKPSDDPVAASRVLTNRVDLMGNRQYIKSLNYAKSFLEYTDQSLGEISDHLIRAKELAISQSNDASANAESRLVASTEVEQLFNQIIQVGNRKLGERFIFGGYKTDSKPFEVTGEYLGDRGEIMIHTDKESFIAMNVPGDRVFHGEGVKGGGISGGSEVQPTSVEELIEERKPAQPELRGPASTEPKPEKKLDRTSRSDEGVNIFNTLKRFEIALRTNDKAGVHDVLDELDSAISQVVLTRAQVGSRAMALDSLSSSLEKAKVDNQVQISQMEDADIFSTISEMNKTESTLQATLQTSGKMIQRSLLDFMR